MIVERPRLDEVLQHRRVLLYGRRKTGKTFYARYRLPDYDYYIVKRNGLFFDPQRGVELSFNVFVKLWEGRQIIIDEFHRAPEELFYTFQANVFPDAVVLLTSTLHYFRRFVWERDAPLLGLFLEHRVDLLHPFELLRAGIRSLDKLLLYQEPSAISEPPLNILEESRTFVRTLILETLEEEDRQLTPLLEGVLEAVAAGRNTPTEVAHYLYSKGLTRSPSPALASNYLKVLTEVGVLRRIPLWKRKKGSIYLHTSPLVDFAYYMDDRYGFFDVDVGTSTLRDVWGQRKGIYLEWWVERALKTIYPGVSVKILEPEVDVALALKNRLKVVAEVKTSPPSRSELKKIEEKLFSLPARQRILFVPDKTEVGRTSLKVLDLEDLTSFARRLATQV